MISQGQTPEPRQGAVSPFAWTVDSLAPATTPAIWVVDLDCLGELPAPTADEQAAAEFYGDPLWARRFLTRRAAVRFVTAALTGLAPEAVGLRRGTTGALRFEPALAGLNVSLSHRGPYAAMAFAGTPIGVDLESVGDFVHIPWNVLHQDEASMLESLPEDHRPLAFLRLWTVKEAYVKALGFGLSREPSSFCVVERDGGVSVQDPLTADRPPLVATRIISSLGAHDIVVSCVTFPDSVALPS
jgi:4'-phosphopantetheinyl transferase